MVQCRIRCCTDACVIFVDFVNGVCGRMGQKIARLCAHSSVELFWSDKAVEVCRVAVTTDGAYFLTGAGWALMARPASHSERWGVVLAMMR